MWKIGHRNVLRAVWLKYNIYSSERVLCARWTPEHCTLHWQCSEKTLTTMRRHLMKEEKRCQWNVRLDEKFDIECVGGLHRRPEYRRDRTETFSVHVCVPFLLHSFEQCSAVAKMQWTILRRLDRSTCVHNAWWRGTSLIVVNKIKWKQSEDSVLHIDLAQHLRYLDIDDIRQKVFCAPAFRAMKVIQNSNHVFHSLHRYQSLHVVNTFDLENWNLFYKIDGHSLVSRTFNEVMWKSCGR